MAVRPRIATHDQEYECALDSLRSRKTSSNHRRRRNYGFWRMLPWERRPIYQWIHTEKRIMNFACAEGKTQHRICRNQKIRRDGAWKKDNERGKLNAVSHHPWRRRRITFTFKGKVREVVGGAGEG